jgi:plastocyanin
MTTSTTVIVKNIEFVTPEGAHELTVPSDTQLTFDFQEGRHTVKTESAKDADPITINNGNGDFDAVPVPQKRVVTIKGKSGGVIRYYCGIHGPSMNGTIHIS